MVRTAAQILAPYQRRHKEYISDQHELARIISTAIQSADSMSDIPVLSDIEAVDWYSLVDTTITVEENFINVARSLNVDTTGTTIKQAEKQIRETEVDACEAQLADAYDIIEPILNQLELCRIKRNIMGDLAYYEQLLSLRDLIEKAGLDTLLLETRKLSPFLDFEHNLLLAEIMLNKPLRKEGKTLPKKLSICKSALDRIETEIRGLETDIKTCEITKPGQAEDKKLREIEDKLNATLTELKSCRVKLGRPKPKIKKVKELRAPVEVKLAKVEAKKKKPKVGKTYTYYSRDYTVTKSDLEAEIPENIVSVKIRPRKTVKKGDWLIKLVTKTKLDDATMYLFELTLK